jgi:ubiquinone/menaquinone biosynthesis C-methylase UbiE
LRPFENGDPVTGRGRDAAWKRTLISLLPSHESPVCVGLACGAGDIAFLPAGKYPRGRIAGVDITEPMLDIARHRNTHPNVSFANQDMGSLNIVSESVDIITGGPVESMLFEAAGR